MMVHILRGYRAGEMSGQAILNNEHDVIMNMMNMMNMMILNNEHDVLSRLSSQ